MFFSMYSNSFNPQVSSDDPTLQWTPSSTKLHSNVSIPTRKHWRLPANQAAVTWGADILQIQWESHGNRLQSVKNHWTYHTAIKNKLIHQDIMGVCISIKLMVESCGCGINKKYPQCGIGVCKRKYANTLLRRLRCALRCYAVYADRV